MVVREGDKWQKIGRKVVVQDVVTRYVRHPLVQVIYEERGKQIVEEGVREIMDNVRDEVKDRGGDGS